jgi:hypothetical protein
MLEVLFNRQGIVLYKFIAKGAQNNTMYKGVLMLLGRLLVIRSLTCRKFGLPKIGFLVLYVCHNLEVRNLFT